MMLPILSGFVLYTQLLHLAHGDTAEKASDNCVHQMKSYEFGGENAKNFGGRMLANTKPVVLSCVAESAGSKWLRFRVNKMDTIDDGDDKIVLYTATGIMCGEGASFDDETLKRATEICRC